MPTSRVTECDDMATIYTRIVSGRKERLHCRANTSGLSDAHARKLGIQLTKTSLHQQASARPNTRIFSADTHHSYILSYGSDIGDRLPHLDHRNYIRQMTAGSGLGRLRSYTADTQNNDTQMKKEVIQRAKTAPAERLSSLALYSPQTQRFTMEQLALEQTRLLKRLTTKQSHRVEHKYYVSGRPFLLQPKYQVNEQQHKFLLEVTNEMAQMRQQKAKKEESEKWKVEQSPADSTHVMSSPRPDEHNNGRVTQPEEQALDQPSISHKDDKTNERTDHGAIEGAAEPET